MMVIANTHFQQHKRRLYTWTLPDGQYWNQIDYILCSQRWKNPIQSAKIRLGADCGSVHKFLIAKFRVKLKKVGKATRPFMYDLNQIPQDYTVEMRNGFKELDLVDRELEELWTELRNTYRRQWPKLLPRKRNARRQSGCLKKLFTNCWGKKRREKQGRKGEIHLTECRVSENSMER